ncbi:FAD-dependent monooxygenase [Aliiroseovarius lamellibrachiae]|uniref:FAD-dependent monooxygenase n=1 Tax=Aliiroseovarius lamellibrachiae TaxID=1924933 RepID=UPI001BE0A36F|nr:FAD-dependent monooxygenase [Aliiroseovarius lamellibrachiae]MBT2131971.1 FAD-dependent monooxygenase [Aliiroseovarius lamellibrachiae]
MLKNQNITIIGGGIGGLTASIALAQRGAQVTVLEQADAITEVGAGLQISPNGFRVLNALGLGARAQEMGLRSSGVWLRDGLTGREVMDLDFQKTAPEDVFLLFHRADLIDLLAEGARKAGVDIQLGKQVNAVVQNAEGTTVSLQDGTRHRADYLVGADGLHSVVRGVLNKAHAPFFTGQVAWRAIVPASGREQTEATVFMGPGRHMVTYPLRGGSVVNIVAVEERSEWADEGWFHKDDPANLRRVFSGFCDDAMALLERVEDVHVWGLFRHPVAGRWHKDRMAILGDAAHPTLPFMAQGAVMAMEDAWVLASSLDKAGLDKGGAFYQSQREDRATQVVEAANKNARNYHYANPIARFAGHNLLRAAGRMAPRAVYGRFRWIYDEDVTRR